MSSRLIKHPVIGDVRLQKRKGAKALRISINHAGQVRVSLPYFLPYKAAEKYIDSKADWVIANLPETDHLADGMEFARGIKLRLEAGRDAKTIRASYTKATKTVTVRHPANLKPTDEAVQKRAAEHLRKALIAEADKVFPGRVGELAAKTGLSHRAVRAKRMTSRWGSCDSHGNITLNCFLLQLPPELVDYVIIHELAHTQHPNHGAAFWQTVEHHEPNYKQLRKELRQHKPILKPLAALASEE